MRVNIQLNGAWWFVLIAMAGIERGITSWLHTFLTAAHCSNGPQIVIFWKQFLWVAVSK